MFKLFANRLALWKSYQQTLRVVGELFLSLFGHFLSFGFAFVWHSCFVASCFVISLSLFKSFFVIWLSHFLVIVLSFSCRFLLSSIVFPCVLSVSSFTATWWSLSNFWFSCVHVWILLFSVCCLHSNLLSILLTSVQFFAFFLVVLWSSHVLLSRVVSCVALSCFFLRLSSDDGHVGVHRCEVFPAGSANTDLHKAFGNEFAFTHLFETGNV